MKKLIIFITCFGMLQMLTAQTARNTTFNPQKHGFKFVNTFKNALPMDIRTGGLCGGMVYSALDYYYKNISIPEQDYRPAERTTLQSYIYNRQLNSLAPNLDKWAAMGVNPDGVHNNLLFELGLKSSSGGQIQELKESIDRGKPVPLGLQSVGDGYGGNHQVLAIGYDMGRYRGDLGNFKEDFKIFIYDPNYPNEIKTLIPDPASKMYKYNSGPRKEWRAYFVDKKYSLKAPPVIPKKNFPKDGKVYELIIEFCTGNDDLRGGNDNLNLVINDFDRNKQTVYNVNQRANWISNYSQFVCVPLKKPLDVNNLKSLELATTFSGGVGGDNWDLKEIKVKAFGGNVDKQIYPIEESFGGIRNRFTGNEKTYTVILNGKPPYEIGNKLNRFNFTFYTGSDDLRGGKDNVNVCIFYTDGSKQDLFNINNGGTWSNNSRKTVYINLNRDALVSQIQKIEISTTASGGMGGDNWNLNKLEVTGKEGAFNKTFYQRSGNPLKRFTGDNKTFSFTL